MAGNEPNLVSNSCRSILLEPQISLYSLLQSSQVQPMLDTAQIQLVSEFGLSLPKINKSLS